ncbi:MAG: fibronectin type III domain-containing protein, partial [Limisphaerales bacterium]
KVTAVLVGATAIAMKWTPAPRARHYRVWWRIAGVDADWIPAGSPADLDFTMEQLPADALVEVAVSAVNRSGESLRAEPVLVRTGERTAVNAEVQRSEGAQAEAC